MNEGERRVEHFLLLLADLGALITEQLLPVVPSPQIVKNVSISLLCRLDLYGPMRPMQIMETSGLSSGGATKLVDRMEAAGLVRRDHEGVPSDDRSVLVELTSEGRLVVRNMARQLDKNLPTTEHLAKELLVLMATSSPPAPES